VHVNIYFDVLIEEFCVMAILKKTIYLSAVGCFCVGAMDTPRQLLVDPSDQSARIEELTKVVESLEVENKKVKDDYATFDDQFVQVWGRLGATAKRFASLTSSSTPRSIFKAAGLFRLACLRDETFQQRLFEALPEDVKYYALYSDDPELMAKYVIPNPASTAWADL
jgi:hypothetical protein